MLTGADIDARYHHDLAGNPVPKPRAVVRPKTTEDVSALLRLCHREKVPVTTQGGMTGLVRGALPNANEIVLSMERMNAVEEVDTSTGVAIAQAGTPLQKIQERVEQDGFMFPLDLGSRGSCTIGGNISTNAGGNRVIRYGMTRDMILGLEVVTADGTVLKGLRKYIKNNTGIDLKHLFIGSEGILGVVTRAALRIFPAPAERQVALCALPSFPHGRVVPEARANVSRRRTHRVRGDVERILSLHRRAREGRGWSVADASSVLRAAGGLRRRRRAHPCRSREAVGDGDGGGADHRCDASRPRTPRRPRSGASAIPRSSSAAAFPYAARMGFDVSLAIDRMEDYANTIASRIRAIDPQAFAVVFGHAGDGNLHIGVHHEHTPGKRDEFEKLVYGITGEFGGSISAEHGIGILKRPYLKLSRTAEEIETMRTLKRAMDPHNILNPGRIIEV